MSSTHERKGRQVEYLTCAETAKLVRAALKAAFPGQRFSVRSSTYSGGASIDVTYTDGPLSRDVEAVAGRFAGATFDGMIDLKSYHTSELRGPDGDSREVHFGADYVMVHREVSPEFQARCIAIFEERYREAYDPDRVYQELGTQWRERGSTLLYRLSLGVAA